MSIFSNLIKKITEEESVNFAGYQNICLILNGGNCSSCAYTIERVVPKFEGVKECIVDKVNSKINLTYDGNTSTISKIKTLVKKLGYEALTESEFE